MTGLDALQHAKSGQSAADNFRLWGDPVIRQTIPGGKFKNRQIRIEIFQGVVKGGGARIISGDMDQGCAQARRLARPEQVFDDQRVIAFGRHRNGQGSLTVHESGKWLYKLGVRIIAHGGSLCRF